MSEEKQKRRDDGRGRRPFSIDDMERNTFALSLAIVLIGVICLPYIEKGGSTWYVLIMVFAINAVLLIWIIVRIINRRRKG